MISKTTKQYQLKNYNFKLWLLVLIACIYGVIVINSANPAYTKKQILGVVLCFIIMTVVSLIDYNFICRFMWLLYFANIIMLIAVKLFGKNVNGATRWFSIPGDLGTIQPSEFTKIILIIFFALYIETHQEDFNSFQNLVKLAGLLLLPIGLIMWQPDLSTSIAIISIVLVMIFIGGLSFKLIGIALLILIPTLTTFLWYVQTPNQVLLKDYQVDRIMSFLHPEDYLNTTGLQQSNSIMAIGSGQLFGKGLNNNTMATVKGGNFISEQQTDFIFSVIGEELGFVGSVILIAIIALIVIQCMLIAVKARNMSGKLIAVGIAALFSFQSFFNICVATGLMPNTGLPMPFISYGLSSLLSSTIGIGLVLNVGLQKRKY